MPTDESPEDEEVLERLRRAIGSSKVSNFLILAELVHDKFLAYTTQGFTDAQALYIVCWEFWSVRVPTQ